MTSIPLNLALDYAKSLGLLMLNSAQQLDHAPFSLAPSPFKTSAFQQAEQLAPDFSQLMVKVANDKAFLSEILKKLDTADNFTQRLGKLYQQSHIDTTATQSISLGIWRSDYLLDQNEQLRHVEINLIASAFPAFASRISQLHTLLYPELASQLPDNPAYAESVNALARAWQSYGVEDAVICFIQQKAERNRFDQLALATALWQKFGIRSLFKELESLANEAHLNKDKLQIKHTEVALVYFRAAYVPSDLYNEATWQARLMLEQSAAIKCPSLPYQLSGMKIIQQQLSKPEILVHFIDDKHQQQRLQNSFMPFFALDEDISAALEKPENYVLKPQREGGGHNLYGKAWTEALKHMSYKEKRAWILMQRIEAKTTENQLIMQGKASDKHSVISELGIYQSCLSDGENYQHKNAGHLLRSKFAHHQEGGIAAGFAALDSPQLIEN